MQEVLVTDTSVDQELALPGILTEVDSSIGLVIFAHGSGSSRLSSRNQMVARHLNQQRISTLLFDLLTEKESLNRSNVFDIELLTERLKLATSWARQQDQLKKLKIAYFGASTGAAAALSAAADLGSQIASVVSRGGRPDLAIPSLHKVTAPTLLLIGANDYEVITLNRLAAGHLKHCKTIIIPGATHLFDEPGTLEQVCQHASHWLVTHFSQE